jgi:hypothetical protein
MTLKKQGFWDLPKASRMANIIWPTLADEDTKKEMVKIVRETEPHKLAGFDRRLQGEKKVDPWKVKGQ